MKKLTLIITIYLMIASLSAHCDGCGTKTEHAHGTLKGNAKYQGPISNPSQLNKQMAAEPLCGVQYIDSTGQQIKVYSDSFIIDDNMNLKNVLVWLKNVSYDGPILTKPAVIDQKGCKYQPHVLGIMKGQKVLIKNSDPMLHNIHSMSKTNAQFNFAMPSVVKEKETTFDNVEEPFYIKCDVHPWMKSWALVQDHPYFAVTDENGNFSIENIPPGIYEVVAWQEKFKMKRSITKTVEIKDSSETVQDFLFIRPEK